MANEREVRYEVKIKTDGAVDAAKRLQERIAAEAQRIARTESQASTAKLQAEQAALRVKQAEQRLATETARSQQTAASTASRAAIESLRVRQEEARLSTATIRAEQAAAAAKVKAEQDALRIKQQQAQVAAAEARQQTAANVSSNVASGLGVLKGGLAAVGVTLGAREILNQASAYASLNVQLNRSRQAFAALSGGQQEAERRLEAIQSASANTMTSLEAMNLANRMVALGMANSAAEMETAVGAARKIAVVMGTDTVGAIENLALAASNLSFMRLDQMGISATSVRERMAGLRKENGDLGKEQAFLQAALDVSNETLKDVDVSGRDAASGVEELTAAWGRLRERIAEGRIGDAANSFFGGLARGIDRISGGTREQDRRGMLETAVEQNRAQERSGARVMGQASAREAQEAESILAMWDALDKALDRGVSGLENYQSALSGAVDEWDDWGNVSAATLTDMEEMRKVLARLADGNGAYARMQKRVTEAGLEQSEAARSLLQQQALLEAAYATGAISADGYVATLEALGFALDAITSKSGLAGAALESALRQANASHNLYVRTAGAVGAQTGPLTADEARQYNDRLYAPYQGMGLAYDKWGAPALQSRQPERTSLLDMSGTWEQAAKDAEEDRQRIAREEEQAAKGWQRTADTTAREMESAARRMAAEFESALGKIPGLLGTSSVTSEDMAMAEAGVYTEKADEWLRQLANEVLNGVDHAGVDIGDAKRRAGISEGTDDKAALAIVQGMWADSSLFADGKNLDLFNQGAIQAHLARQDASASGRQAILDMLGGNASTSTRVSSMLANNAADPRSADATVAFDLEQVANAMKAQITSESVAGKLSAVGTSIVHAIHGAFTSEAGLLDWAGPIVDAVAASATALALGNINQALQE